MSEIVERVLSGMNRMQGFPATESTVTALLSSLRDTTKGNRDLASLVMNDLAMTQKVLKLANSPMYAPFAKNVSTISAALNVLGADSLLHLVLSTVIMSAADLDNDVVLSRIIMAGELARSGAGAHREDVGIAALMFDLGRLLASRYLSDEFALIAGRQQEGMSEEEAANAVLGISYSELGAAVARRWRLPDDIVSIIDGSGDPDLVQVARATNAVAQLIQEGRAQDVTLALAKMALPGIDPDAMLHVSRRFYAMRHPATPHVPELSAVQARLRLDREMAAGNATIESVTEDVFSEVAHAVVAKRCALYHLQADGSMRIVKGCGDKLALLKARLVISPEFHPTAFHAAIKNKADVAIAKVSMLNPKSLPEGYRTLLPDVIRFLLLPIISDNIVRGMLYVDWESDVGLLETELDAVRSFRGVLRDLI